MDKRNIFDVIKNSLQAGLDAQSWPKDLDEYKAQSAAQGGSFDETPGAVAFRIYLLTAAEVGESDKLRTALYSALVGEMCRPGRDDE